MISVDIALTIFLFILIGSGYTSWKIGHKNGTESMLQYLVDNGVIEIDYEDEG